VGSHLQAIARNNPISNGTPIGKFPEDLGNRD
jgi:hypothetical protein